MGPLGPFSAIEGSITREAFLGEGQYVEASSNPPYRSFQGAVHTTGGEALHTAGEAYALAAFI